MPACACRKLPLKVFDIDSERMMIRIEQGKGRKDRNAMLSPRLLELLREWWLVGRPTMWLFPGRDPLLPITTRQLNRVVMRRPTRPGSKSACHRIHCGTALRPISRSRVSTSV